MFSFEHLAINGRKLKKINKGFCVSTNTTNNKKKSNIQKIDLNEIKTKICVCKMIVVIEMDFVK